MATPYSGCCQPQKMTPCQMQGSLNPHQHQPTSSECCRSQLLRTPKLSLLASNLSASLLHRTACNGSRERAGQLSGAIAAAGGNVNGSSSSSSVNGSSAAAAAAAEKMDVSSNCVQPVFRTVPRPAEDTQRDPNVARVLFLSEGNVCRSVYAEAIFKTLIKERGLEGSFECASKGTRDYNIDEPADPRAVLMAAQCGVTVEEEHRARVVTPAADIVDFDLVVVMDKFNAADFLKEVSVFDTINPSANYSAKVRVLGSFCKTRNVGDIDDPLYGNMGGPEELDLLSNAITDIQESCSGLIDDLVAVKSSVGEGASLCEGVQEWLRGLEALDWLVPPMLQKRN